ncbi:MAG TPA: hypothetical protein ENH95_02825 [Nitrosopumilus sp.]|nr:hypothetical protein [Nitrosopumilus sp.]
MKFEIDSIGLGTIIMMYAIGLVQASTIKPELLPASAAIALVIGLVIWLPGVNTILKGGRIR